MADQYAPGERHRSFTDVQRRVIYTELVKEGDVEVLSVEKELPGGSSRRIMLLNKVDAQAAIRELQRFLDHTYAQELAGMNSSLGAEDMVALFGLDEDQQ